jgi:hypothetical protein
MGLMMRSLTTKRELRGIYIVKRRPQNYLYLSKEPSHSFKVYKLTEQLWIEKLAHSIAPCK